MTSYANRTSPVLRGKWILENILGTPPPPPPPNVPPLKDTDVEGKASSRCASGWPSIARMPPAAGCHQLMDPAGLSMENFDAIGRWRIRTEAGSGCRCLGRPARRFDVRRHERSSHARCSQRPELFVATLTEKLLTYALGRGRRVLRCAVRPRTLSRDARANDYRFSVARARHRLE